MGVGTLEIIDLEGQKHWQNGRSVEFMQEQLGKKFSLQTARGKLYKGGYFWENQKQISLAGKCVWVGLL